MNFREDIFRVIVGAVRSQLEKQRQTLLSNAEQRYIGSYDSGSFFESMLYMSNIKKAKQKVNADVINKIKNFDGFFKTVVMNLKDTWAKQAQQQGKVDINGAAERIKQQGNTLSKALIVGNNESAQQALLNFSSFTDSNKGKVESFLDTLQTLPDNVLRSIFGIVSKKGKETTMGEDENRTSNSVWDSIRRTHKQMIRYGGAEDSLAGSYKDEMDIFKA